MINDVKVIDNFYSNPDDIVDLLSGDYPIVGCGSGKRSVGLQEISPKLYNDFCKTIYTLHGLSGRNMHIYTFFMEHNYNPNAVLNQDWIHIDGKNPDACRMITEEYKLITCGQIFLTPNPDLDSDVEICRVKPWVNWSRQELIDRAINDYTEPGMMLKAGKITRDQFKEIHKEFHENLETTCVVKNIYNRMISWRAGTLHGAKLTPNQPKRLTQFFFVQSLGPLDTWPGEAKPMIKFSKEDVQRS